MKKKKEMRGRVCGWGENGFVEQAFCKKKKKKKKENERQAARCMCLIQCLLVPNETI